MQGELLRVRVHRACVLRASGWNHVLHAEQSPCSRCHAHGLEPPARVTCHASPQPSVAASLPALPQYFTVKMSDGVQATSYSKGDKFFIDPQAGGAGLCFCGGGLCACLWVVCV